MSELILNYLPYFQLAVSVLLIVSVVLQQTGASLGGAFGADNFSSVFHKRRGAEKFFFELTIVLSVLLVLSAILKLVMV